MTLRAPIGRARGLGSAKNGAGHFWAQRITAVALVPLLIWFVLSVVSHVGASYETMHAWLASPCNAALLTALLLAGFHHAQLGLQVVIEDYVSTESTKLVSIIAVKFAAVILGIFCAVAVLRTAVVGG